MISIAAGARNELDGKTVSDRPQKGGVAGSFPPPLRLLHAVEPNTRDVRAVLVTRDVSSRDRNSAFINSDSVILREERV